MSLLNLEIIDFESVYIVIVLIFGQVLIAERTAISSALYDEGQNLISAEY